MTIGDPWVLLALFCLVLTLVFGHFLLRQRIERLQSEQWRTLESIRQVESDLVRHPRRRSPRAGFLRYPRADALDLGQPRPNLRVDHVRALGLFGTLNHEIGLKRDSRVTIVLGPNGVGKTQILECLSALLRGDFGKLASVPFDELSVDLDDGVSIRVRQERIQPAESGTSLGVRERVGARRSRSLAAEGLGDVRLLISLVQDGSDISGPWSPSGKSPEELPPSNRHDLPPWILPAGIGRWLDTRSGRRLTTRMLSEIYGVEPLHLERHLDRPDWLVSVLERTSVWLIETQRLLRIAHRDDPRTALEFAVRDVAEHLEGTIHHERDRHAGEANVIDRTYVDRFLEYAPPNILPEGSLQKRLDEIAQRRARLESLGLLRSEAPSRSPRRIANVSNEKRTALQLFADDMDKKLRVLEPLAESIERLLSTINRKLRNKQLVSTLEQGLVVRHTVTQETIELERLSSGEQHELVLLYNLHFRVPPNSLVLIDEPELSLHPLWQQEFVDDLIEIAQSRQFDVVLATHSPYIVGNRSDLCVSLSDSIASQ